MKNTINRWIDWEEKILSFNPTNRKLKIHYESLVKNPKNELVRIFNYLDIAYEEVHNDFSLSNQFLPSWEAGSFDVMKYGGKIMCDEIVDLKKLISKKEFNKIRKTYQDKFIKLGYNIDLFRYDNYKKKKQFLGFSI